MRHTGDCGSVLKNTKACIQLSPSALVTTEGHLSLGPTY